MISFRRILVIVTVLAAARARYFLDLDRVFETHEHFTAEKLYDWLRAEDGSSVSRATVYRTLAMLVEGGFLESLEAGRGELLYEHVLGHRHHDHIVCLDCGRIEEFVDERIEELQQAACERKGFTLVHHSLRLEGYCKSCAHKRERSGNGQTGSSRVHAAH